MCILCFLNLKTKEKKFKGKNKQYNTEREKESLQLKWNSNKCLSKYDELRDKLLDF